MVTTDLKKEKILKDFEHNHPRDRAKVDVLKSMHRMKEKAKISMVKPTQIFAEEVHGLSNDIRACLPLEETVKRTLRNQRSSDYPVIPDSLSDLKIDGKKLHILFYLFIFSFKF